MASKLGTKKCGAHNQEHIKFLGSEWGVALEEFNAFIAILCSETLTFYNYGIRYGDQHLFQEQWTEIDLLSIESATMNKFYFTYP